MKLGRVYRLMVIAVVFCMGSVVLESNADACFKKLFKRFGCCKPACCQPVCCEPACCGCETSCCESSCDDCGGGCGCGEVKGSDEQWDEPSEMEAPEAPEAPSEG